MLYAYLDASDPSPGEPLAVVAGFVGNEVVWAQFNQLWAGFLAGAGLRRFHASDFWARAKPFHRWPDQKRSEAIKHICHIMNACGLFGVGMSLSTQAFDEWHIRQPVFITADPVLYCLDRVLAKLIPGITQYPIDEGVSVVIDQDKKRQRNGLKLAEWHERKLRSMRRIGTVNPDRPIELAYQSSLNCLPLQAADILSNSVFRQMKAYLRTSAFEENPFIVGIKERCAVAVEYLHDPDMIDINFRSKIQSD